MYDYCILTSILAHTIHLVYWNTIYNVLKYRMLYTLVQGVLRYVVENYKSNHMLGCKKDMQKYTTTVKLQVV